VLRCCPAYAWSPACSPACSALATEFWTTWTGKGSLRVDSLGVDSLGVDSLGVDSGVGHVNEDFAPELQLLLQNLVGALSALSLDAKQADND